MNRYISILKGINVGGNKKILMADLKLLLKDLGFSNIQTYIQSGNIVFETTQNSTIEELEDNIQQAIFKKYGFDVTVIVRTVNYFANTIKTNPFLAKENIDEKKLHVTFLRTKPTIENFEKVTHVNYPPDEFKIIDKNVFVYCPERYGETKLHNGFFEKALKVKASTRNWRTVNKLYELAAR